MTSNSRPRAALFALLAGGALLGPLGPAPMGFSETALAQSADAPLGADPRAGDPEYQRAQRLFGAIREILDEAARTRLERQTDPESPLEKMVTGPFGLDQNTRIEDLLSSAFELMTDTPVVQLQDEIAAARGEIVELRRRIGELKERRVSAPDDAGWEGWVGLKDDRKRLTDAIEDLEGRIDAQEQRIAAAKDAFGQAMADAGAPLPADQVDLLLESVTGGDLVSLAAAYEAVRGVSQQLRALMDENGEDLAYARRYYGMHTALIAVLVEAQTRFLDEIDGDYMPRLSAIEKDINAAARETDELLRDRPTRAQREVLGANKESQRVAKDALRLYREYLRQQRAQVRAARDRALKELRVADNTLRTVDASFQLRRVMESAASSFEALQSLEAPGFERLFRNEELRREFQELTDKLSGGS